MKSTQPAAVQRLQHNNKGKAAKAARGALTALALAVGMTAGSAVMAGEVKAAQQASARKHYEIVSGPLAPALNQLAGATGIMLTYAPELSENRSTQGLNGDYTVKEAFDLLLMGTGLWIERLKDRTYVLRVNEQRSDALEVAPTMVGALAERPGAIQSSREAHPERQDLNSLVRSMPGTYTMHSRSQPGVSVNIRGLSGLGRVNTMIDGVTQTFRNNAGHGSGGPMAFVDPNLLAGVDVQRGAVDGAEGANTLGGTANFRTFDIDDIVKPDHRIGFRSTYRTGNNGYGNTRMFAAGARTQPEDVDGVYGIVAAVSSTQTGEYETSSGQTNEYDTTKQSPRSGLLKLRLQPNDMHRLDLSGVKYRNEFYHNYPWQLDNETYRAKYAYTPYSEWVSLTVNAYQNKTELEYPPVEDSSYIGRKTRDDAHGFDFTNISRFNLGVVEASWSNGARYYTDDFVAKTPEKRGANPEGKQATHSVFSTLELNYDIYALTLAGHYDGYKVSGHVPKCSIIGQCLEIGGGDIDVTRREHSFNPRVGFAVKPYDWMQLYTSWSRTTRAPRVQEIFFEKVPLEADASDADGVGANPFLRQERSTNYEFGVNFSRAGLLGDSDYGQLKINRFISKIDGYITPQSFDIVDDEGEYSAKMNWVNWPEQVRMDGYEVEGRYDVGFFYTNLSWTRATTKAPTTSGIELEDINSQPDRYWTLDIGTRWFDERLVLGARGEYSGSAEESWDWYETKKTPSTGVLWDVYGSLQVQKNLSVFFNVENVANKVYSYNASVDSIMSASLDRGTGRGRTASVGFTFEY
ncbi:TonB-dependent receptor [Pseudomonas sp. GD03860]|uniref:TonB-dependent receptor n=1 Tax=Pseudomonas TaxID=286 RepID=UPI002363D9B0|nr:MULTISPECIES: TonB-dependent receptor [Pseudomonas]MDD2061249.1 TonB-dependent receptor [Pseudomonas putida]MDH0639104.1 TonB-dependent receptor [Pseudomonas sp. GD03860]